MNRNENKTINPQNVSIKNTSGNSPFFQPKLTINESGDQYEQEADRMAEHVMRMPIDNQPFFKPSPLSISPLQRKCKSCEDDEKLHRKENNTQPTEVSSEVSSYINSLSSKGSPLPDSARSFFEPRFGQNFSDVKIHNDVNAAKSSQAINALAYTVGNNIVFNQNQFSLESGRGKRLLAHELTHVVQQQKMNNLNLQREPQRYYSYTTADYVQQVKDALTEINPIAGVGNPGKAYNILNEIDTSQLEEVLLHLGNDNLSIIKDIESPSHANSNRTQLYVKAAYLISVPVENLVDSEVMALVIHLGLLDQQDQNELVIFMQQSAGLTKAFSTQQCIYNVANNIPELSYELADAPCAPDQKTRVKLWLQLNLKFITDAENQFTIDRRAIAGAIAWEAIENIRSSWTPSSVGPGKVHIKRHPWSISHSDTVANQVEDAGYLPRQSSDDREKILSRPSGAIIYIAAIMKAGSDIAFNEGKFDISKDPKVLTWFYNSKDLPDWTTLIKAKKPGSLFDTKGNKMSAWVEANINFLEDAVGKPSFLPSFTEPSRPAIQRKCKNSENEEKLNRKENSLQPAKVSSEVLCYIDSLSSKGVSLSDGTKKFFEPKFDHDFSNVKIHNDTAAAKSSQSINALAYTVGNNIIFNKSQFSPESNDGKKLLAHELTHVVQQNRQGIPKKTIQRSERCNKEGVCDLINDGIEQSILVPAKTPFNLNPTDTTFVNIIPKFARDTDCNVEAPVKPVFPTPPPFSLDSTAQLPDKENAPNLDILKSSEPWWNDSIAEAFGKALADCYVLRTANSTKPINAVDKLIQLQNDFDQVIQGSFGRSTFGTWHSLTTVLQNKLQAAQKNILSIENKKNMKLPKGQRKLPEEIKQEVETQMQKVRYNIIEDVRKQVALGTWAWMAERREKLDFETIKMKHFNPKLPNPHLSEILTDPEIYALAHDLLVAQKKELTEKEIKNVEDSIKKAKAKKNKQPETELTDEERTTAIEKAELAKVIQNWKTEFNTILAKERAKKDAPDLVIPTLPSWGFDNETTQLNNKIASIVKILTGKKADKEKITLVGSFIKSWWVNEKKPELKKLNVEIIETLNKESNEVEALKDILDYIEKLRKYRDSIKESKEGNKINKNVADVLQILETEFPRGFTADNYEGHGGGSFQGRFHSVDMYPKGSSFGFFDKQVAFDFALAIDRSVGKKGGSFQILYNDFVVAREVNKVIENGLMINIDNVVLDPKDHYATSLNWHGPLVTHFHVDFVV